ncbi:MAG: caspase family protein, partial [Bacteroides sp.]|nr:caspase family protein [Bacteroides sp.]
SLDEISTAIEQAKRPSSNSHITVEHIVHNENLGDNSSATNSTTENAQKLDTNPELTKFNEMLRYAEQGNSEAQKIVGYNYLYGLIVPQDYIKANYYLEKAHYSGDKDATMLLGQIYFWGLGKEVNKYTALQLYEKAASLGQPYAQYMAGIIYSDNSTVSQNFEKAFSYFEQSTQNGNLDAKVCLGKAFYFGIGTKVDIKRAISIITECASANNGAAQEFLSSLYANGDEQNGIEKDETKALIYLNQAAQNGVASSQRTLAWAYFHGMLGLKQDDMTGFKWLKKSADSGDSSASNDVGNCYAIGKGVEQSDSLAFKYFLIAAENGDEIAMHNASLYYYEGKGVDKNDKEAFRWAKLSAQKEYRGGYNLLAKFYRRGVGTTRNLYEAESWAKKAAELNYFAGYENLAELYLERTMFNPQKALDNVDKAIELYAMDNTQAGDKSYLPFYDLKGRIYLAMNQSDSALKMAERIIVENPDYTNDEDNSLMIFYRGDNSDDKAHNMSQIIYAKSDVDENIPINATMSNAKTFAVIIGNEHYSDVVDVEFANKDAETFAKYCSSTLGIPQSNIRLYQDATFGKMMSSIEDIKNIASAYDGNINIVFYYAGHGIPNEADRSSYLLPIDGSGKNTNACVSLTSLYDSLYKTGASNILVFLDACFSGANRGEGMTMTARGVAIKAQQAEPADNMVIFSAASGDETAHPYKEKAHGLFTYYLLKKLQESKGEVTLCDLSDYIAENVRRQSVLVNKKSQTPYTSAISDINYNWFRR